MVIDDWDEHCLTLYFSYDVMENHETHHKLLYKSQYIYAIKIIAKYTVQRSNRFSGSLLYILLGSTIEFLFYSIFIIDIVFSDSGQKLHIVYS